MTGKLKLGKWDAMLDATFELGLRSGFVHYDQEGRKLETVEKIRAAVERDRKLSFSKPGDKEIITKWCPSSKSREVFETWRRKYLKHYGPKGRFVEGCLDCGHPHGELEKCPMAGCVCTGGVDSNSTMLCAVCGEKSCAGFLLAVARSGLNWMDGC
jgi:hypothetical protein